MVEFTVTGEAGFHHRRTAEADTFVEHPEASARDAVHIVFSGQMVRSDDYEPNADIEPTIKTPDFRTVTLETLARMKLNSFRRMDQVHLLDMISVGLIDESWLDQFPPDLRLRLKELLEDPNG